MAALGALHDNVMFPPPVELLSVPLRVGTVQAGGVEALTVIAPASLAGAPPPTVTWALLVISPAVVVGDDRVTVLFDGANLNDRPLSGPRVFHGIRQ